MKILFYANQPHVQSGYGKQALYFKAAMEKCGHTVAVCGAGLSGGMVSPGVPLYPAALSPTYRGGDAAMWAAAEDFDPDITIALFDAWSLGFPKDPRWGDRPWIAWATIDAEPLLPEHVDILKSATAVVSYSQFGQRVMQEHGIENTLIPLGVPRSYRSVVDKDVAKRVYFGEEFPAAAFVVGAVGRNNTVPSRKCFPESLLSFSIFHDRFPDTRLYLHTTGDERDRGVDLESIVTELSLEDAVIWSDPARQLLGMGETEMVMMYNSLDVLLQPSANEGFGLPIIEAQACGVPVICSYHSAMIELNALGGGWFVDGQLDRSPVRSWYFKPHVHSIIDALVCAYRVWADEPDRWHLQRQAAVRNAAGYDYERTTAVLWRQYLDGEKWKN